MNRRVFTSASLMASIGCALAARPAGKSRLLVRSSWQTVNIGDIGHTPGVLSLLEKHLPDVEVRLWASNVDNGVREMLGRRFPKVRILTNDGDIATAFRECVFLLHGSGPSLVAEKDVARWSKETGKPYGVYGITFGAQSSTAMQPAAAAAIAATIRVLSGARFVYFRDSVSLGAATRAGCSAPLMEFSPDGAFAVDLADDEKATAFLTQQGLEDGKFLCCIPRLRYTPYWLLPEKNAGLDVRKQARNDAMKEHDAAPLREAIIRVIRGTGLKVLLCPEDKTQMAVAREMLFDKLPAAVKSRVVWRSTYWLTDEALSTYRRSAGLFGHEMHSPIMCIGHGIPAIVCRWAEQTSKGFMWRDIGLGEWLFDFDKEADCARLPDAVLKMAEDPTASRALAAKGRAFVMNRFAETMGVVGRSFG
jgi:Polysaccharide pyruvyl transferase